MTLLITCDICDRFRDDPGGVLRVLPPLYRDYGGRQRFAGHIATIRCHEDNSMVKAAVESPGNGRVLVVAGGASVRRALVGGHLGAAAAKNGWAGLLVDGAVRDVDELAALPIGVRALASMPLPPAKRGEGQADVAVQVQGLWLRPGEWLVADEDGTVVLDKPV